MATTSYSAQPDLWSRLSALMPTNAIQWRQEGRPIARDGRYYARFVCYVDANTVRERLDAVVPGEWDLTLEPLPSAPGEEGELSFSFKARLQILGVVREDVGKGRDYKSAATDAFKRAAVRFGIAHELYAYEQNWVQVDGDRRYAKPMEDPAQSYARRYGKAGGRGTGDAVSGFGAAGAGQDDVTSASGSRALHEPACPKCGGHVWDNLATKRNPKAPDFNCRSRLCDGAIWPAMTAAAEYAGNA